MALKKCHAIYFIYIPVLFSILLVYNDDDDDYSPSLSDSTSCLTIVCTLKRLQRVYTYIIETLFCCKRDSERTTAWPFLIRSVARLPSSSLLFYFSPLHSVLSPFHHPSFFFLLTLLTLMSRRASSSTIMPPPSDRDIVMVPSQFPPSQPPPPPQYPPQHSNNTPKLPNDIIEKYKKLKRKYFDLDEVCPSSTQLAFSHKH
jgi:hypothetical protein